MISSATLTRPETDRESAAAALDRLLLRAQSSNEDAGRVATFLIAWQDGQLNGDLVNRWFPPESPARFDVTLLSTYIFQHPAVVRPIAFGRHRAVTTLAYRR